MRHRLSPTLAVLGPMVAAAAAGLRWLLQGSGNIYTDLSRQFYVPDPDLGWRLTDRGPIWLGLDAVAALATALLVATAALWWLHRRESRRQSRWRAGRTLLWAFSLATLVVPVAAFATGLGPGERRDTLPPGVTGPPLAGVEGSLDAPAGTYQVVNTASTLVATLKAGGESFEARFGGLEGTLRLDPTELEQPMEAVIAADAASVDTGIELRSEHAREDLQVDRHPQIELRLRRLIAAEPRDQGVAFSAEADVTLVGRRHPVRLEGVLRVAGADARERLGTSGPTLIARARLHLDLRETAIGNDGTFDQDVIPISASLVLTYSAKEARR